MGAGGPVSSQGSTSGKRLGLLGLDGQHWREVFRTYFQRKWVVVFNVIEIKSERKGTGRELQGFLT